MKNANQKAKLLYLYRYLNENTDSEHPATVKKMIEYLEGCGISAERKSIYSDIETLRNFGLDIISIKSKNTGYFVGERDFEYAELFLLADVVRTSRFITAKKSNQLINKLKNLASRNQALPISRKISVSNRVKSMNESIYYSIDAISEAMEMKKRIKFLYFRWNENKERELKNGGRKYYVLPLDLIYCNDFFYLVCYDEEDMKIKHFRVDMMNKIEEADRFCDADIEKLGYSPDKYSGKVFGMFGGQDESISIWCDSSLAGVFIDRFGKDIVFRKAEGGFETTINVEVSPVFLSWIISFGDKARVISPQSVIEDIKKLAADAIKYY